MYSKKKKKKNVLRGKQDNCHSWKAKSLVAGLKALKAALLLLVFVYWNLVDLGLERAKNQG